MNTTRPVFTALLGFASLLATACGGSNASKGFHSELPNSAKAPQEADGAAAPQSASEPMDEASSGADAPVAQGERSDSDDAAPAAPPAGRSRPSRDQAKKSDGRSERRPGDPFNVLPKPKRRPGLATSWGEQRSSRVSTAPFTRAERSNPFAVAKLFYNDAEGIRAMSDTSGGFRNGVRTFPVGGGHLDVGLRDSSGRFLTGFAVRGDNFVTATAGRSYSIVVRNNSPGRVEAVVSVDGLDVIDGKAATVRKRGYLIDPFGDVEIDGFRTSNAEVAAFRFGSVRNSYTARKHGNTRNVGVIGVAVFHERGDSPSSWRNSRNHDDVRRRHGADPFPGRFAAPPN